MSTAPDETPAWRPGALYHRALTDAEDGLVTGREVTVYPLLFGRARVCEGPLGDEFGYDSATDYDTPEEAIAAAKAM